MPSITGSFVASSPSVQAPAGTLANVVVPPATTFCGANATLLPQGQGHRVGRVAGHVGGLRADQIFTYRDRSRCWRCGRLHFHRAPISQCVPLMPPLAGRVCPRSSVVTVVPHPAVPLGIASIAGLPLCDCKNAQERRGRIDIWPAVVGGSTNLGRFIGDIAGCSEAARHVVREVIAL